MTRAYARRKPAKATASTETVNKVATNLAPWASDVLIIAGIAIAALFIWILLGTPGRPASNTGPALLAALPILAVIGLVLMPFAPDLDRGRWIPVDVLGAAIFVGGMFLGWLYGLPVVDPDALKNIGQAAGTFTRPSTKLDAVIGNLMPALTGGVLTFALTEGSKFSAFFIKMAGLPDGSPTRLLGVGILLFFGPLGFKIGYCLTATIGALAFKQAAESIVNAAATLKSFPLLPDVPFDPTPEQIVAAKDIAGHAYSSLTSPAEKAAWARAQAILGNYAEAVRAFQDSLDVDPRNVRLIVDFAITLYNNPNYNDVSRVIGLLDQAEQIAGSSIDVELSRRARSLRAAAALYLPGGYETTIQVVNDWIRSGVPPGRFSRFYRACAFGQLYESCVSTPLPNQSPYVVMNAADRARLISLVENDVAITLAVAGEPALEQVSMVIDPSSAYRTSSNDDDLQMLAADTLAVAALAGMKAPPPPPATEHPVLPRSIPNPLQSPGALATWIDQQCPT